MEQRISAKLLCCLLIIGFAHFHASNATFSPKFRAFLTQLFGSPAQQQLSRLDFGPNGSFGGGNHEAGCQTRRRPVVFVHGWTSSAPEYMNHRAYFLQNGYKDEELYATTYANGSATQNTDSMFCDHVKQIRNLFVAVHKYTASKIDIDACSMGSPISRKAVLGGKCVDTGEELGAPLTSIVHTWLGVAGVNHGAVQCLPFAGLADSPCNNVTGMICGSQFLNNVNNASGYEASEKIVTLYSNTDEEAGVYSTCENTLTSIVSGQQYGVQLANLTHHEIIFNATGIQVQYSLLQPSASAEPGPLGWAAKVASIFFAIFQIFKCLVFSTFTENRESIVNL